MEPVLKRCRGSDRDSGGTPLQPGTASQLTQTLSQHSATSLAMSVMMDKLARMDSPGSDKCLTKNSPVDVGPTLRVTGKDEEECGQVPV